MAQKKYLDKGDERRRRLWTKFHTGCLELREEMGRWECMSVMGKQQRVPRSARICTLCFREVEDAHHAQFQCVWFKEEKAQLLKIAGGKTVS